MRLRFELRHIIIVFDAFFIQIGVDIVQNLGNIFNLFLQLKTTE